MAKIRLKSLVEVHNKCYNTRDDNSNNDADPNNQMDRNHDHLHLPKPGLPGQYNPGYLPRCQCLELHNPGILLYCYYPSRSGLQEA